MNKIVCLYRGNVLVYINTGIVYLTLNLRNKHFDKRAGVPKVNFMKQP